MFSNSHFVAGEKLVGESVLSLVVGKQVSGEAAKRTNFEKRSVARQAAEGVVDEKEIAAIEHSGVRETQPDDV